jgi:cytochrome c-type biogenesis protein CcmH
LAVAVCFTLGASDAGSRFNDLGHRLMCTCGCAQLLGECNHVGCTESGRERNELKAGITSGASDKEILAAFASKYGATVLAAPTTQGFDLVAWIAPFAVFGRWARHRLLPKPTIPPRKRCGKRFAGRPAATEDSEP